MGKFITSASFITPSAFFASGTATGFPPSNVGEYDRPYKFWKSAADVSSGTTWVAVDFGAETLPNAIFIDNINVTSIKIEAAADNAFTSSLQTSSAITISQDPVDGRYKYCSLIANVSGVTFASRRYWRVADAASSTVDSTVSSKFLVGGLSFFSATTEWAHNMLIEEAPNDAFRREEFAGGGDETYQLGEIQARLTLTSPGLTRSDMRSTLHTVLRYGESTPFLFFVNDTDTSQAYIVKRRGVTGLNIAGPNHFEPSSVVLHEVV